jgi:RimJ/RimL family protein N-acetyltransferase
MVTHDKVRWCSFSTERLIVDEWHDLSTRLGLDLIEVVTSVLTEATTAALPSEWSGDFDKERARTWVEVRDAESPTLLAVEHETGRAIGLLILFEAADEDASCGVEVRLGYVIAEVAWGRGFASELVGGLVEWARLKSSIRTISAGIAPTNEASERVLLRNGFLPSGASDGEQIYQIFLKSAGVR